MTFNLVEYVPIMVEFPPVISFMVTSRCTAQCDYCFGPKGIEELPFERLKEIFALLSAHGAKAVLLTGGEPLMREDFKDIVEELANNNLKVFVDTNGDLFSKYQQVITEKVGMLGLPIDFPDASYRGPGNLQRVLAILEYFRGLDHRPKIRVGTVVTQDNYQKLSEIGALLKKYPVDLWKLYEFLPHNAALRSKERLEVSREKFEQVTLEAKKAFPELNILISRMDARNRAYFFIYPDGSVLVPIHSRDICREKKIGTIFDQDIVEKWEKEVSKGNYLVNASLTFGTPFP